MPNAEEIGGGDFFSAMPNAEERGGGGGGAGAEAER